MTTKPRKYNLSEINEILGWKWSRENENEVLLHIKLNSGEKKIISVYQLSVQQLNDVKLLKFYGHSFMDHKQWLNALQRNRKGRGINIEIEAEWNLDTPKSTKYNDCNKFEMNVASFALPAKDVILKLYSTLLSYDPISIGVCNIYIIIFFFFFLRKFANFTLPYS